MKDIWVPAVLIPVIAAVILAIGIVAIGELLLFLHGTPAVLAATGIMILITIVAVLLTRGEKPEGHAE